MKKKTNEAFEDGGRLNIPDLTKKAGTAAKIIKDNSELFMNLANEKGSALKKEDVIDLCHKLFDDAGLDTEWTRIFFLNLGRMSSGERALQYVYNAMLKGNGFGVIGRRRMYEDEDINESMNAEEKEEFKKKLKAGEVKFVYKKKDGSMREARGTLKIDLMDLPKKIDNPDVDKSEKKQIKKRHLPADSVFYYDLDAKGFRSFKMDNFEKYL